MTESNEDLREAVLRWDNCLAKLEMGDFNYLPKHEWICTGNPKARGTFELTPTFGKPIWDGETEPITLLVNADFGAGDTIHFFRFISAAKERVSRLILRCDADFHTLFRGVELLDKEAPLPEFDKIIHMMALPRALGLGFADISGGAGAYLSPNPDHLPPETLNVLDQITFMKIGACWNGSPFNPTDFLRTIPVEHFQKLILNDQMKLFSLSKIHPAPENFIDVRAYMADWNQTAHLISKLDLVISVDTAIAHLAGAMGKSVWLLVPYQTNWRWGTLTQFTVWYKTMQMFRQKSSWEALLAEVAEALERRIDHELSYKKVGQA